MTLSIENTLTHAERLVATYRPWAESIVRSPRGVLHSEMLFFFAIVQSLKPGQIIESGRAQGQSTLLASLCFPDTPIISIERDASHPDVAIAKERLADQKNVQCLFGDARVELPARTQEGDVVLIDGPKDFRALKLAGQLIRENKPAAVFLHDCHKGSAIRDYLDRHMPWTFFADDPTFQQRYKKLDGASASKPAGLACIAPHPAFDTLAMRLRLLTVRWTENISRSVTKRV